MIIVLHIFTIGFGYNISPKYNSFKNGGNCYLEIKSQFCNDFYLQNLATLVNWSLIKAKYYGKKSDFTLDMYYNIIPCNFNNLSQSGNSHYLKENQKAAKFKDGLQEYKSINCIITFKTQWDTFPADNNKFDTY